MPMEKEILEVWKRLLGVTDGRQDGWRERGRRNKLLSFYQQPYYIMKICVSL